MTKQLVRYSIAVMTTLLGLVILWEFRIAVAYLLISVTLASAMRPLATRLAGQKIIARIGWILLYLVVVGGSLYMIFFAGKIAVLEIQQVASTASKQDQWTLPSWLQGSLFQQMLVSRLLPPSKLFQIATYGQAQVILPAIVDFTQSIANVVSRGFILLILSLYWIINKVHFERLWLSLLPYGERKQARDIWQTIEPNLGAYIRSQSILTILAGVLLGLGYWAIGSPYPMLMALVGAFVTAIPFVGVILAVVFPLVVGLLTGGQATQLLVVYTIGVLSALVILVKPRLFNRRWENPILTLVLIAALAKEIGLIGIIVAPPLTVVIQILWNLLVIRHVETGTSVPITDFKLRQEQIWSSMRSMEEPPPPQVISTMDRLSALIEKAEPVLKAGQSPDPSDARSLKSSQTG
jgi:predicted PurR-regulated permease PerM